MASLARSVWPLIRASRVYSAVPCRECRHAFATTPRIESGHNKWSKIKHGKAINDAKRTATRTTFTKSLYIWSKMHGPNPESNPQLASTIAAAKKAGVPKAVIDGAVARGQGKTKDGATLDSLTFEAIMPPSVALIAEVETESRARALQEFNHLLKKAKGSIGASKFFFSRVGRVVLEGNGKTVDEIMDEAIEAGAGDIEDDEDGNIIVWTQPNQTTQVYQALADRFDLKLLSSDILWTANEDTKVQLDQGAEATNLAELLAALKEHPEVQAVYSNVTKGTVADDVWETIEESLDE